MRRRSLDGWSGDSGGRPRLSYSRGVIFRHDIVVTVLVVVAVLLGTTYYAQPHIAFLYVLYVHGLIMDVWIFALG
jgi:hypothetical protein